MCKWEVARLLYYPTNAHRRPSTCPEPQQYACVDSPVPESLYITIIPARSIQENWRRSCRADPPEWQTFSHPNHPSSHLKTMVQVLPQRLLVKPLSPLLSQNKKWENIVNRTVFSLYVIVVVYAPNNDYANLPCDASERVTRSPTLHVS